MNYISILDKVRNGKNKIFQQRKARRNNQRRRKK
jgi:hypothetical protein